MINLIFMFLPPNQVQIPYLGKILFKSSVSKCISSCLQITQILTKKDFMCLPVGVRYFLNSCFRLKIIFLNHSSFMN